MSEISVEGFFESWGCDCDGEGNYFHSDDIGNTHYEDKKKAFNIALTALIKQEQLRVLPPKTISDMSLLGTTRKQGYNNAISDMEQNISNYTIERGEK